MNRYEDLPELMTCWGKRGGEGGGSVPGSAVTPGAASRVTVLQCMGASYF